jgi:hypothetical protein
MSNETKGVDADADAVVDIIPNSGYENSTDIPPGCCDWLVDCLCCCYEAKNEVKQNYAKLQKARRCFNFWEYVSVLFPLIGGALGTVFGALLLWFPDMMFFGYTQTIITGLITLVTGIVIHLQPIYLSTIKNLSADPYLCPRYRVYLGRVPLNPSPSSSSSATT